MVSIPNRLTLLYKNLKNCDLILNNKITDYNISELQLILNKSVPKYNEYILYNFIKSLSSDSKKFNTFIKLYDIPEIILWANTELLTYELKLDESIKLKPNYFSGNKIINNYFVYKKVDEYKNNTEIHIDTKPFESIDYEKQFVDYEKEFHEEDDKLWDRRNNLRNLNNIN